MQLHQSFTGFVQVRGAREHNLKNVDLIIPRDALVVFTGVSGSGKSSLAFGTLYAEAQRRFLESVSPYARRLFHQMSVPDVDSIDGLPPAIALQQQRGSPTTRSSVGSVTTLSNLLRMLYSRAGDYPRSQPLLYAESFSPNTPEGACPKCHGLGRIYEVTEDSMVPDPSLTIRERAVAAWPTAWHGQNLRDILITLGYNVDKPWKQLSKKDRDWILFTEEQPVVPVYAGFSHEEVKEAIRRKEEPSYMGTFTSARRHVLHSFANTQSPLMKKRALTYMLSSECPLCHGKRLRKESLSVTFAGLDIADISRVPLARLEGILRPYVDTPSGLSVSSHNTDNQPVGTRQTASRGPEDPGQHVQPASGSQHLSDKSNRSFGSKHAGPTDEKSLVIRRIAEDLLPRLKVLLDLGLGYLSLERSTPTLSPGELQRLRLATQVRSNLFGVVYVLDEPSAGLHPADTEALLTALRQLKASGNSLFVVEHDLDVIRQADWLVDVGPAAGEQGGFILYSGPPEGLAGVQESQTRRHLFGERVTTGNGQVKNDAHSAGATGTAVHRQTPASSRSFSFQQAPRTLRTPRSPKAWLSLTGITRNNLHQLDISFPLGTLTTVTGISGSGKSSLVSQALVELVAASLGQQLSVQEEEGEELERATPIPTDGKITGGIENIKRLVRVDQKPIGRTPRSNLATYTGLFDHVRKLFAATKMAKARHYEAGRFSFNVAKGRCPTCEGEGFVMVELLFLPSVYAPCPTCHGARYNEKTLEIRYRDRNISEVLGMTVAAAYDFFADEPHIRRSLDVLLQVGLGYLRLGQPATEL
ncbi:MAG: excinuclease ABC subunit UvrA, partial [Bacteroidota bacterium]